MQRVSLTLISYCTCCHTRACRSYEQRHLPAAADDAVINSLAGFTQPAEKSIYVGGLFYILRTKKKKKTSKEI